MKRVDMQNAFRVIILREKEASENFGDDFYMQYKGLIDLYTEKFVKSGQKLLRSDLLHRFSCMNRRRIQWFLKN